MMSRPGSCTSKLCGPARISLTYSDTRRLSGHSPHKWSLVCTVSSPTCRRQTARYDGGRPSALLAWSEEMVRHKLSSLLPQLAAAPQALSLEEFSALVDRMHEAHVVSPPQQTPAPACLRTLGSVSITGVSGRRHTAADRYVLGPAREMGRAGAANTVARPRLSSSSLPRPVAPPSYLGLVSASCTVCPGPNGTCTASAAGPAVFHGRP
ncbi:hypothetical protein E2C01_093860 [Portunus trituberculatus]|uniref:Uncharacterized protein n=1 Tax=Portunus trituberculatus TaxID=210409 RepID=A0A5B7JZA1_PORTR|nr:hypothetical protein [Portunus trituberculatus]